jgi:hypothetical protein
VLDVEEVGCGRSWMWKKLDVEEVGCGRSWMWKKLDVEEVNHLARRDYYDTRV